MGIFQSIRAYTHRARTGEGVYQYTLARFNQYGQGVMDLAFVTPFQNPARDFTGQPHEWVANQGNKRLTLTPNEVSYALGSNTSQDITGGAPLAGEPGYQPLMNNFYLDGEAG